MASEVDTLVSSVSFRGFFKHCSDSFFISFARRGKVDCVTSMRYYR